MTSMNTIVRATAGAGKTTGLLEAVYDSYKQSFLSTGAYPKILLSTFTVKAANELIERLTKKAIEERDAQFLNFVSSGFLEVGTLHAVFLKVFENLKADSAQEAKQFVSTSVKRQIGRSIFHQILVKDSFKNLVKEARQEAAVLDLFWHLYSHSFDQIKSPQIVDVKKEVVKRVVSAFDDLGVDRSEFDQSLFEDCRLIEIVDLLEERVESSIKKKKPYRDLIKFCLNPVNQLSFLDEYVAQNENLLKAYHLWREKVNQCFQETGAFDIGDVEVNLLDELQILNFDKKIWDYCFFDEYQDTSPIQKEILNFLAKESVNYFVGDPFQSIYFFRGARKDIFLNDFKDIEQSGGVTDYRLNNYRSAIDVVEFSNGLIKHIVPDFIEMSPFHTSRRGKVEVVHFEEGEVIDELEYVAQRIQGADYSESSAVVLCRSVKELLLLSRILKAKNQDFKLALSRGFEASLETLEISSLLRFTQRPHDDENFYRLVFSAWVGVPHSEVQTAVQDQNSKNEASLWAMLQDHEGCEGLKTLLENVPKMNLSYALISFICESGFLAYTDDLDSSGVRERNIIKFLGALSSEELKQNFNVMEFCDDVEKGFYRFESEDLSSKSGVTLMTVHGSKGLQFDDVYLIGANKTNRGSVQDFFFDLEEHHFGLKVKEEKTSKYEHCLYVQNKIDAEKQEILEERRRLLYVALTRAKKNLIITGAKKVAKDSKDPTWMSLILKYLEVSKQEGLLEVRTGVTDKRKIKGVEKTLTNCFLKNTDPLEFADQAFKGVTQNLHEQEGRDEERRDLNFFSKAIAEGVLFHELVEKAQNEQEAKELLPVFFEGDNLERHENAIKYLFENKELPFDDIFKSGFREWGFDTGGEESRSGKIDLWAEVDGCIWIVDYKTGALDNIEKGFDQLGAYREVLKEFSSGDDPEFKLALIFPYKRKTFIR